MTSVPRWKSQLGSIPILVEIDGEDADTEGKTIVFASATRANCAAPPGFVSPVKMYIPYE